VGGEVSEIKTVRRDDLAERHQLQAPERCELCGGPWAKVMVSVRGWRAGDTQPHTIVLHGECAMAQARDIFRQLAQLN
jgi:hypothetical protein